MILQRTPALSLVHCLLVIVSLQATSAIYLPWKEEPKENSKPEPEKYEPAIEENQIYRHHETSDFRYDEDILRYLKICGRQLMIWRCRNAVKPYFDRLTRMVPLIDLYCSVIGNVATVSWYHKHKKIDTEAERPTHRYDEARKPHQERGRQFTVWTDFRLRIHNLTRTDSGMYRFEVTSPDGDQVDEHLIFVDVSGSKWSDADYHTKRKKKRKTKKLWHTPLTMDHEQN